MEMAKEQELILVLDFGSQYNQLITRRIREMGVYSELHDHEISIEEIKRMNPKGIILSEWLIHTVCSDGKPKNNSSDFALIIALPYSRSLARSTFPPNNLVVSCIP